MKAYEETIIDKKTEEIFTKYFEENMTEDEFEKLITSYLDLLYNGGENKEYFKKYENKKTGPELAMMIKNFT